MPSPWSPQKEGWIPTLLSGKSTAGGHRAPIMQLLQQDVSEILCSDLRNPF